MLFELRKLGRHNSLRHPIASVCPSQQTSQLTAPSSDGTFTHTSKHWHMTFFRVASFARTCSRIDSGSDYEQRLPSGKHNTWSPRARPTYVWFTVGVGMGKCVHWSHMPSQGKESTHQPASIYVAFSAMTQMPCRWTTSACTWMVNREQSMGILVRRKNQAGKK